jgi:hypothetical protein
LKIREGKYIQAKVEFCYRLDVHGRILFRLCSLKKSSARLLISS